MKFNPFVNINPKIYAYTTPDVPKNNGWTKIGYTTRDSVEERIKEQTHTANIAFNIEWHEPAIFTAGPRIAQYFTDHDFHEYLERFCQVPRNQGTEWFQIDGNKSHQLFHKFAAHNYDGVQVSEEHTQYILRAEQQEAVDKTVAYYNENKDLTAAEFLWNAKPRFGKTLTTYDFMRRIKAVNVLIVTNRPSIANSWYEDFTKFISWQEPYLFVSETDALSGKPVLSRQEFLEEADKRMEKDPNADVRMVAFESLQGLKGSVYFGGEYDKLQWIQKLKWDLLVIDEAHEGVDTYKTDTAFRDIERKFTLHLSGTPFKAIAKGKFGQKQIFNWSFSDEQEAKENWYKNSEEYNPYGSMPKMNLYTYQMSKIIQDKVNQGANLSDDENAEYAFDLNEFFSTNGNGKFKYEKDVKKFLNALTEQEKFPFSTKELRDEMAHTFWIMERVDSVKAMAKLLKEHPVFENYEVVIAAGDGRIDDEEQDNAQSKRSYDKVREAIGHGGKTITLSVGQLTTGVTIPEWTAVFMLSNMRSSAEYIQAAFRAQNPYKFEKEGKFYQKENAYIFDFAPERTLMVYDEFANSLYSRTSGGQGTKEEREENIRRLINFFSVFAEDEEGKMVELDAAKVLTVPIRIKATEVVNRGFMCNMLFNISRVYGAPKVFRDILKQIKITDERLLANGTRAIDNAENIQVNENGEIDIPQEIVVNSTNAIFGDKIYEPVLPDVKTVFSEAVKKQEEAQATSTTKNEVPKPQYTVVEDLSKKVSDLVSSSLYGETQANYGITNKQAERIANNQTKVISEQLKRVADDFTQQQRIIEAEKKQELQKAATQEQKEDIERKFQERHEEEEHKFVETLNNKAKEVIQESAQNVARELETRKQEKIKSESDKDIKKTLRSFSCTIPSFTMAYGDANFKLSNMETYPKPEVFKEVTGITAEQFKLLRDGGDFLDPDSGEVKHYDSDMFDEAVFDESIQIFLDKKNALANYFDETHTEDIFDYIPPQETNQIFTPKKVVQMMVDQLEENEPDIFNYPDKTFVDFYMKSGLYITEIVKRLFRNPLMKDLYPNDHERIKHILECQVFGFAPTQIIFDIAMSYIFGFNEESKDISRRNFFSIDTLPRAQEGTLQELVNEVLGDRVKE